MSAISSKSSKFNIISAIIWVSLWIIALINRAESPFWEAMFAAASMVIIIGVLTPSADTNEDE
jgi:membrane protein DedA with SNARE-associated domain